MKQKKYYFMLFFIFCAVVSHAAENLPSTNARPFIVYSDDVSLVPSEAVRHRFADKFTANLNASDRVSLRKQGYKLKPVGMSRLAKPPQGCDPWPACNKNGGNDTTRALPDNQVPWGIRFVYNIVGDFQPVGGAGVNVAVLDSGVTIGHPDLANRILQCMDFTRGTVEGTCKDQNGHGTHVAGTIAADGGADGLGIFGVAPQANILAYKVCKGNNCWNDDMAAGMDYAGSHGAHIISMSIGSDFESELLNDAIARNAHVLFVVAAGNDGPAEGSIDFPAANPDVIAVAAMGADMTIARWSSRGIDDGNDARISQGEVELAAPGVTIESTWKDGGYTYWNGTSMATPHISGVAALLWYMGASVDDIRMALRNMATDIDAAGYDIASGYGAPQLE